MNNAYTMSRICNDDRITEYVLKKTELIGKVHSISLSWCPAHFLQFDQTQYTIFIATT